MNHKQRVSISTNVSEGLAIDNLRLACEAADQPGGSLPEGVHVACGPAVGHAEAGDAVLSFTIMADDSAPDSADIVLRLVGDEPSDEPWAYVTVNAKFSDASPRLEVSPDRMDTGVVRGESVSETLSLKNTGYEKMENVRIRLTDSDGEPAPDWIMPSGEKSLGDIGIGETKQAGLVFSPTESTSEGLRDLTLRIASDNHPEALIGVRVAVVQSGTGSALVKVSDIYTGTVDPDTSRTIEGLSGASVVLQNETVATEVYTARTDAAGEAVFSDIPAGLYACRVSADGHNPHSGTVKIKPGVTASESVFLMNRLVTVEWSVTETTIEDVYEIEAVATFETDVPAPVVVFEPAGIVLPSGMKAGDVHRGEFKMTNRGLVRAESIRFELPENDPYFQFELADALPETLEAKQSAVVAYRVVCLKSLGDDGSDGSGGETECAQYTYEADIRVVAEATCSDGVPRDFYWDQKIKVPFDFCYEVDEDGNIASEIDIGSEGASIDTSSYGIVNEPECTGGSEDCILCSAKRPEFEIEIDRCALMDALVFGSDPLDAVTLKVSSPAQGTPDIQGDHGPHGGHGLVRRSPQGRIHPLEDGSRGQGPRRKDQGPSHLRRKPMAPRALPDEHARPRGAAARFRDLRRRNRKDRQKPRRLREKGRRPLDPPRCLLHSGDARRVQMGGQGRQIRGLRRIRPLRRLGRPRRRDRNVDLRTGRRRKALRIRRPKRSPDPLVLVQRRRPDIGRIRFRKPPGGIRIRKRPARARRRCSRERNHIRLRRPVQACPRNRSVRKRNPNILRPGRTGRFGARLRRKRKVLRIRLRKPPQGVLHESQDHRRTHKGTVVRQGRRNSANRHKRGNGQEDRKTGPKPPDNRFLRSDCHQRVRRTRQPDKGRLSRRRLRAIRIRPAFQQADPHRGRERGRVSIRVRRFRQSRAKDIRGRIGSRTDHRIRIRRRGKPCRNPKAQGRLGPACGGRRNPPHIRRLRKHDVRNRSGGKHHPLHLRQRRKHGIPPRPERQRPELHLRRRRKTCAPPPTLSATAPCTSTTTRANWSGPRTRAETKPSMSTTKEA